MATAVDSSEKRSSVSGSESNVKRKVKYSEDRLNILAQFKKTPPGFLEDRRSVYWVDKVPPSAPTVFALTKRQQELVKSKEYHPDFKPDRPSSIWKVSSGALSRNPTPRLNELSQSKPFHPNWVAMKSAYSIVPYGALHNKPSERLNTLSQAKEYKPLPIRSDSQWDWGEWVSTIPPAAKTHIASARLEQLAESKPSPNSYMGNRSVIWPVAPNVMQVQATTRVQQLARPKTRQALDQDYDPYRVSFAARMAVPSPRVVDLALPIPRKVRPKKV
ncbi:sperm microtubule associated protein 2-like isoform X2 [Styela clava]|uniref:testicular haploid expressed gene protein-like isoform X2 n=1 Tax=Styela clava TaxID=7725 RepID=UPI0019398C23|nr:testicular haploid expressed gene protein-like isoform X2 [Styela clava]